MNLFYEVIWALKLDNYASDQRNAAYANKDEYRADI